MASTYDKVIGVISKTPDRRKDFEVNNLLSWFRKKSDLFGKLKTELLFDIIKNLQFVTKTKDEVIIRQGDQGDCMYILLRGKVTIYILYASKAEGDDDKPNQPVLTAKGGESLRQQLGTFVVTLGAGAVFGEVALLKEDDCMRTASIITDETCDFVVIDRELYNRSVKNVLKKEFEDKTNFIATNPYFQLWAPKYKKQLAMALQKETVPYEGTLVKQGDSLAAIYFILAGEVKMVMDPAAHKTQYPKLFAREDSFILNGDVHKATEGDEDEEGVEELLLKMSSAHDRQCSPALSSKFRRKPPKRQPQEVCLLGVNEAIGDIEVLLGQDTYMQTAVSTQRSELLVLEMKHYERLLVKRNPRTIESMKENLELRLKSRTSKHLDKHVPLLKCLLCKAEEYNQQKQQQEEARQNTNHEKSAKQTKTLAASFDSFLPPRGPVIDERGPGTVWYRIRERHKAKALKQQSKRKMFGGYNTLATANAANNPANNKIPEPSQMSTSALRPRHMPQAVDPLTSDPVLSNLENRMRMWLGHDGNPRTQMRVARLQRGVGETDQQRKPGAKVVVRPRQHTYSDELAPEEMNEHEEQDDYVHHGNAWVSNQ